MSEATRGTAVILSTVSPGALLMKKLTPIRIAAAIMAVGYLTGLKLRNAMFEHLNKNGLILGANSFSKEEKVAFDLALEGFQDQLVMSRMFKKTSFDGTEAERSGNTFWRPQPYIAQSFTGRDQSANFNRNYTQLSVPASLGYSHSVPLTLSATELRDALQEQRLGKAAMQRLGSDINLDCSNLAAVTGTVVIKRTAAASGYDDVAACDDAFNRVGIDMNDRRMTLPSNHYNSMAGNLAQRQNVSGKVQTAYEKAFVGQIANFDTYKLDYGYRLTAAAGVTVTVNGANQRYVPKATSTAVTGETSNVDNRYQNLTIGVSSGIVKVGDAFTIAGVNEVHHITKQDTGSLKTFRIAAIVSGAGGAGVIQISPPIIAADSSPTDPEVQYKNVTATPANGAAITFLNTTSSVVAPFWHGEAFEILPGKYVPAPDSGLAIMSATTDNGITVTMARQGQIGALDTFYRWDVWYGLTNLQPQMTGIELFSQT
jgi:hypothetical protein